MMHQQTTPAGDATAALGPQTTTDHDTIRRWAEARAGFPVHTVGPLARSDPRSLRIRVPGVRTRARVEPIQWHEWFERFDEQRFAFVCEERAPNGPAGSLGKLVRRRRGGDA